MVTGRRVLRSKTVDLGFQWPVASSQHLNPACGLSALSSALQTHRAKWLFPRLG